LSVINRQGITHKQLIEIALGFKAVGLGALDQRIDEGTGASPTGATSKEPVLTIMLSSA
jgi:hypothetical protein